MRRLREVEPVIPEDPSRGEIQILDYGEVDMVRPGRKPPRRRSLSPAQRRNLAVLAAAFLGAASVWAWTQPRASASQPTPGLRFGFGATTSSAASAAPSLSASAGSPALTASASPSGTPLPTPVPLPTASPWVRGGWIARVDVPIGGSTVIGPIRSDGTIYVSGAAPIDRDGNQSGGSLSVGGGSYFTPEIFGPDGVAYGVVTGEESGISTLWAFGPDNLPRYSLQLPYPDHLLIAPGPDGSVTVVMPIRQEATGDAVYSVLGIDNAGIAASAWTIPGEIVTTLGKPQFLVRPDGSIATTLLTSSGCSTHFLAPRDGTELAQPGPCWMSLTQTDHGLLAWSCTASTDVSSSFCSEGTIALLGGDGQPTAGWPRNFKGAVSQPVAGQFGVYFERTLGEGAEVRSLRWDGRDRSAWQVAVKLPRTVAPTVDGPLVPESPVLGEGDTVFVQSDFDVAAYSNSGQLLNGWPELLVTPPWSVPIYSAAPGSQPTLFVSLDRDIQAVDPDAVNTTLSLFRDDGSDFAGWLGWQPMPGGGVVVFDYHAGNNQAYVLVVYLAGRLS